MTQMCKNMVASYTRVVQACGPDSPEARGYRDLYRTWDQFTKAASKVDADYRRSQNKS